MTFIDPGRVEARIFHSIHSLNGLTHSSNFPDNPTHLPAWLNSFMVRNYNSGSNYFGRQLKTIFVPPESGAHIFYFHVNKEGKLYLTHPNSNEKLIVTVNASTLNNLAGAVQSSPQILIAYEKYPMKVLIWEKLYSDHTGVGVKFPSGTIVYPITDEYLLPPN